MVLPGELWIKAEILKLNFDPEPPYRIKSHPSMSVSDVTNDGDKIVQALAYPGNSLAFRLLCKKVDGNLATGWTRGLRGTTFTPFRNLREFCAQREFLTHSFVAWLHWNSKSKEHNRQSCELPHVSTRVAAKELVTTMDAIVFLG